jgi:O-methyltransferase
MPHVEGHTGNMKHIFMANLILGLDPTIRGDLVECGSFKGSSAISLSHVAERTRRRLIVCDSFQGLPPDCEPEMVLAHHQHTAPMKPGDFKGARDEVEANIRAYGVIERVKFIEGFFDKSLVALRDPIAFAFIDVDLVSSTKDCLRHIWPLMSSGGIIVTDDAPDLAIAKVYFDDVWWRENLGCDAPGLIGTGCGVWVSANNSTGQGYIRKP